MQQSREPLRTSLFLTWENRHYFHSLCDRCGFYPQRLGQLSLCFPPVAKFLKGIKESLSHCEHNSAEFGRSIRARPEVNTSSREDYLALKVRGKIPAGVKPTPDLKGVHVAALYLTSLDVFQTDTDLSRAHTSEKALSN